MLKILLFDMDDVLLEARGYHRALQNTVAYIATSLGYDDTSLTQDDIAVFEAAGVTSEWDSSAICATLLLEKAWSIDPQIQLPSRFTLTPNTKLDIEPPDFNKFATDLGETRFKSLRPRLRAEHLIINNASHLTNMQKNTILDILHNARQIDGSLTHRIFQELILGSLEFKRTYNLDPFFDTESYLSKYDIPTLSPHQLTLLIEWLQFPDQRGVILTNRPSRAPRGFFCTPEAEIGTRRVGLDNLPIAGFGGLAWLSHINKQDQEVFIKPSPVHALTALRLALGDSHEDALNTAAALVVDNQLEPTWQQLQGSQVFVFEDTIGGLESLLAASKHLQDFDIYFEIHLIGISSNHQKRISLESIGACLYPSLSSALEAANIIPDL